MDIIDTSFNQFVETMLELEYELNGEFKIDEHEKIKYIKVMTFITSVCRLNAYKQYIDDKVKLKNAQGSADGVASAKLNLPISKILNALQPQNIDYVFNIGFMETIKERKSEIRLDICLMSIDYLLEMLYYVRDMENSTSQADVENAEVLKQKLFTLQQLELVSYCLENYKEENQSRYYLHTCIRYLSTLLDHLEKYSTGKILYIRTHRQKAGKSKGFETSYDEEHEALDYNTEGPLYLEKRFNFIAGMTEFVTYTVIRHLIKPLLLTSHPENMDDELLNCLTMLLNRIVKQVKGTWFFYQLDTFVTFSEFLAEFRKNAKFVQLVAVIKQILNQFFTKMNENPLLALEIIFPFPDRQTKDRILTNYELGSIYDDMYDNQPKEKDEQSDEDEIDFDEFNKRVQDNLLKDDEKSKILEYFEVFKDDMGKWNQVGNVFIL